MTTDATKPYPFHGKPWLKEHEEKLEVMVQKKKDWNDIADALGRTPDACKARLTIIRKGNSKLQQPEVGIPPPIGSNIDQAQLRKGTTTNELSLQKEVVTKEAETQLRAPWSAADELLLVQLRAINMPYNDIVGLLSVRRSPGSISRYFNTLKIKNMGFLDDYYRKIGHPYASTNNSDRRPSTVTTTADEIGCAKAVTSSMNSQVEQIADGMGNLRLKNPMENEHQQQPTVSVGLCEYCHRSVTTFEPHQQPACLQCKSVLEHYTPYILRQLARSISISPKNHIPINEKDRDYILHTEYKRYMKINIPKRMQGGIEIERPRASHQTMSNIASIHGLVDGYTNIQGHWTLEQDSWDHLEFAYFQTKQGQVRLVPALAIIAYLAKSSTEEDITAWIGALGSK